jgi:hypothetical protein
MSFSTDNFVIGTCPLTYSGASLQVGSSISLPVGRTLTVGGSLTVTSQDLTSMKTSITGPTGTLTLASISAQIQANTDSLAALNARLLAVEATTAGSTTNTAPGNLLSPLNNPTFFRFTCFSQGNPISKILYIWSVSTFSSLLMTLRNQTSSIDVTTGITTSTGSGTTRIFSVTPIPDLKIVLQFSA